MTKVVDKMAEVKLSKAYLTLVRIAPRKVRLVLDLVRGKDLKEAEAILLNVNRGAARTIYKVVESAKANAIHNYNMDVDKLYVYETYANEGPTLKRMQPHAKGQGFPILKRTSKIYVALAERSEATESEE